MNCRAYRSCLLVDEEGQRQRQTFGLSFVYCVTDLFLMRQTLVKKIMPVGSNRSLPKMSKQEKEFL
jgi:hypothetical protein